MKVTFKHLGESLASSRYRAIIPARQLKCLRVEEGNDWLVIGKHGWDWGKATEGFSRVCFDVCDDHFSGPHADHYLNGIKRADLVTCNSHEMARLIESKGVKATVIPDPFEQHEREAKIHDSLLWFGHRSNLRDLAPWLEQLDHPIEIVSNIEADDVTYWTPYSMNEAFERAGLVVIPTGKSMAKSGNRAIESIRRGLFVVAGYLPAYADLGIYMGNIADGVDWALAHPDLVLQRIRSAQHYVLQEYSPARIGKLWLKALSS